MALRAMGQPLPLPIAKSTVLATARTLVQTTGVIGHCCEYELFTFILASTALTSGLGGSLNRMAKSRNYCLPC